MSGLSTHILDTAHGKPAAGVLVSVFAGDVLLASEKTNADGRIPLLLSARQLSTGIYRLVFAIGGYFAESFFPEVSILFEVKDPSAHYHVPLLISPFAYSTYRGS